MQQGVNIPIICKLFEDNVRITDLSSYDFDALIICENGEKLLYSTRDIKKNGDISIVSGELGFVIDSKHSSLLKGRCFVEIREWLNGSQYIGVSKSNNLYFNVEPNEIHTIC